MTSAIVVGIVLSVIEFILTSAGLDSNSQ